MTMPEHHTCNRGKQAVSIVTSTAWHKLNAPALCWSRFIFRHPKQNGCQISGQTRLLLSRTWLDSDRNTRPELNSEQVLLPCRVMTRRQLAVNANVCLQSLTPDRNPWIYFLTWLANFLSGITTHSSSMENWSSFSRLGNYWAFFIIQKLSS